jgi:hypothetical protein
VGVGQDDGVVVVGDHVVRLCGDLVGRRRPAAHPESRGEGLLADDRLGAADLVPLDVIGNHVGHSLDITAVEALRHLAHQGGVGVVGHGTPPV